MFSLVKEVILQLLFKMRQLSGRFQLSDVFSYLTSFWSHARRISGVLLCVYVERERERERERESSQNGTQKTKTHQSL